MILGQQIGLQTDRSMGFWSIDAALQLSAGIVIQPLRLDENEQSQESKIHLKKKIGHTVPKSNRQFEAL